MWKNLIALMHEGKVQLYAQKISEHSLIFYDLVWEHYSYSLHPLFRMVPKYGKLRKDDDHSRTEVFVLFGTSAVDDLPYGDATVRKIVYNDVTCEKYTFRLSKSGKDLCPSLNLRDDGIFEILVDDKIILEHEERPKAKPINHPKMVHIPVPKNTRVRYTRFGKWVAETVYHDRYVQTSLLIQGEVRKFYMGCFDVGKQENIITGLRCRSNVYIYSFKDNADHKYNIIFAKDAIYLFSSLNEILDKITNIDVVLKDQIGLLHKVLFDNEEVITTNSES